MTNDTRKPREFWLHPSNNEQGILSWRSVTGPLPVAVDGKYGEALHVIEYSAYEALKKNQTAYRTFEAIAGDCKEKADMQDEIDALRKERDKLLEHFNNCNSDKIVSLVLERDEYRAALEKIKAINATEANGTDKERASSYWYRLHRIQSFAKEVLAIDPEKL